MLLPFGRGYHEKELWFGPTRGIPIIWKTSHILLSLQDVHLTTTKLCCSFLDISPTSQIRRYECQNLPKSSILRENPSGHPCPLFLFIISRPNLDIFFMSIKKDEQEISLIKKHLKKTSIPQKKKNPQKLLVFPWIFNKQSIWIFPQNITFPMVFPWFDQVTCWRLGLEAPRLRPLWISEPGIDWWRWYHWGYMTYDDVCI